MTRYCCCPWDPAVSQGAPGHFLRAEPSVCGRIFSPRRLCCMFMIVLMVGLVYMAVARPQETQSKAPSELPST